MPKKKVSNNIVVVEDNNLNFNNVDKELNFNKLYEDINSIITQLKINIPNDIKTLDEYLVKINLISNTVISQTQILFQYSDKCNELTNLIQQQIEKIKKEAIEKEAIEKEKKKKEELKKNKNFATLDELISSMDNFEQIKRLQKILPDNQDYAKVYLQGYTKNSDKKKKNLLGTITILGQYNFQKKEREVYQIKVFENEPHSLWCSCIDHKLNSSKKNTVCKHISFIVCKVMKVLDLDFFETKQLTETQLQSLLNKFSDKSDLWKNKDYVRNLKQINLDTFKNFPTPLDDVCTFCYDQMNDQDIPHSVCCPSCKHSYHSECMDIWLENYLRCSVCSSDVWKHYKVVKSGEVVNMNSKEL
jgi:hypothetical protein